MDEPIRVLHVDDEPGFAELTADFLEREDDRFAVTTETRPSAALEHLADHDVDCVISDYDMPELNGIEFLEAVRNDYPELPFVLFTGKGSEEVASDAISAGVTDYLQKEVGTEHYALLANRVRNAVRQSRTERVADDTKQQLAELAVEASDRFADPDGFVASVNELVARDESVVGEEVADAHGWTVRVTDGSDGGSESDAAGSSSRERGECDGGARFEITGVETAAK